MQAVWKGQTKEFSFHNSYYILDRGTIGKETFPVVSFLSGFCYSYKRRNKDKGTGKKAESYDKKASCRVLYGKSGRKNERG